MFWRRGGGSLPARPLPSHTYLPPLHRQTSVAAFCQARAAERQRMAAQHRAAWQAHCEGSVRAREAAVRAAAVADAAQVHRAAELRGAAAAAAAVRAAPVGGAGGRGAGGAGGAAAAAVSPAAASPAAPPPWACSRCTTRNTGPTCEACRAPKGALPLWSCSACRAENVYASPASKGECQACHTPATWSCERCSMENPDSARKCELCDYQPGSAMPEQTVWQCECGWEANMWLDVGIKGRCDRCGKEGGE